MNILFIFKIVYGLINLVISATHFSILHNRFVTLSFFFFIIASIINGDPGLYPNILGGLHPLKFCDVYVSRTEQNHHGPSYYIRCPIFC